MFLLLKDLLIPSHLHPYLIMAKICWTWHKFIVCAPITGLKLSSLACKTGFYKPKHKRKGGLHGIEFWRSWTAEKKCCNRDNSNSGWKNGVICLATLFTKEDLSVALECFAQAVTNCLLSSAERRKRAMSTF